MPDEIVEALRRAVDGWWDEGRRAKYVCPYAIGRGGEGWVIAAERHAAELTFGAPCASYVAIKFPPLEADGHALGTVTIRSASAERICAEHERRSRLGKLPHLGQAPEIRSFPRSRLRDFGLYVDLSEEDVPVLITPLSLDRAGGPVPVTLRDAIPPDGLWCAREIENWRVVARSLALALWCMHANGWAHGDVKPDNIVLYQSRGVWRGVNVIDFGLLCPDFPQAMQFDRDTSGSPHYVRPERFVPGFSIAQGKVVRLLMRLRPSTEDAYALGVVLIEALLGARRCRELREEARAHQPGGVDDRARRHAAGRDYGVLLRDEARRLAEDRRAPQARTLAYQLCVNHLLRWPAASQEATGIDILSAFLQAVDTHLPRAAGAGGAGRYWTLSTQISALRALRGANPEPTCEAYADAGAPETADTVQACADLLRRGHGRKAAADLERVLLRRIEAGAPLRGREEAYEFAHGLRLFAGLLMLREGEFERAARMVDRARAWLSGAPAEEGARAIVAWWADHLAARIAEHERAEQRRGLVYVYGWGEPEPPAGDRPPEIVPPAELDVPEPFRGGDRREAEKARAWYFSLECDRALHRRHLSDEALLGAMQQQRGASESSYESAYGALQIARSFLVSSQRGKAEAWHSIMPMLVLSAAWALVKNLHHEYAAALIVAASAVRSAFRARLPGALALAPSAGAEPPPPLLGDAARDATTVNQPRGAEPALDAPPSAPTRGMAGPGNPVAEHLQRGGADREECLIAAAECALKAAELYARLDVPEKGWQARLLAAECYRWCDAPENRAQALRWLSLASNNASLAGQRVSREEDAKRAAAAAAAWARSAEVGYKGTAGGDPGAFFTRAMLNRYGVGMAEVFGGTLAVDLLDERGRPAPGEAFRALLAQARRPEIGALRALEEATLLDLGCGLGQDSLAAAQEGFRRVRGVDSMEFCVQQANRARQKKQAPWWDSIELVRAELTSVQAWGGESYTAVLCHEALTRITHRGRLLQQIRKALQPGGVLLLAEWIQKRPASHGDFRRLCETTWLTGLETLDGYLWLLREAGFSAVHVEERGRDMHAFFSSCHATVTRLKDGDPSLDPAALERGRADLGVLAELSADDRPLGWCFIVAARQ